MCRRFHFSLFSHIHWNDCPRWNYSEQRTKCDLREKCFCFWEFGKRIYDQIIYQTTSCFRQVIKSSGMNTPKKKNTKNAVRFRVKWVISLGVVSHGQGNVEFMRNDLLSFCWVFEIEPLFLEMDMLRSELLTSTTENKLTLRFCDSEHSSQALPKWLWWREMNYYFDIFQWNNSLLIHTFGVMIWTFE